MAGASASGQVGVVAQDDDGALRRRKGEERLFDELAVGRGRRPRGSGARARRCSPTPRGSRERRALGARLLVAGADEELREPGIEPLRFTEPRELTPGLDHRLLNGVLGRIRVPEDLAGDTEQPLAGRVEGPLEGVRSC